jgi:glutamyl-Q tRNA(Asp) synthetase
LLNAAMASRFGGRFLLRIEDIDVTRCRPELERGVYEDLAWLGLTWEQPVRRQSDHFDDYRAAALDLRRRGLLYPCFCSRKAILEAVAHREALTGRTWPRDPDGVPLYPGTCRAVSLGSAEDRIASGEPCALRLDHREARAVASGPFRYGRFDADRQQAAVEARPERWGDAVIVRKDVPTSYHLSVVVDDAIQGVTHVVRGTDLEASTDLHVLLQALLAVPTPLYHHHALVRGPEGAKLSKSLGSEALRDLRARGIPASAVRERLGFMPQATPRT